MKTIPRYQVRLPGEEKELDGLEILEKFRRHELTTVNAIRPVEGGELRELRADPVLAPEVWRMWQGLRRARSVKFFLLMLTFSCLMLSMVFWPLAFPIFTIAGWQLIFFWTAFYIFFIISLLLTTINPEEQKRQWRFLVPLFNSVAGYREIREVISHVPDSRQKALGILNFSVWAALSVGYVTTWFAPGTRSGGLLVYGIYSVFLIGLPVLFFSLLPVIHERANAWLRANPEPEKPDAPSPLRSAAQKQQTFLLLRIGVNLLPGVLLLAAMLTVPYAAVGKIRLARIEHQLRAQNIRFDFSQSESNSEVPIILREIPVPPFPAQYQSLLRGATPPPSFAAELAVRRQALDDFRHALRQYLRTGNAGIGGDEPDAKAMREKIDAYLDWRKAALLAAPAPGDGLELMADWRLIFEALSKARPESAFFEAQRFCYKHKTLLELRLDRLTDRELETAGAELREVEARLGALAATQVFASCTFYELLLDKTNFILRFYRDNIQASVLELAARQADLLQFDYFQNHLKYQEFTAYRAQIGLPLGFLLASRTSSDNDFNSATRADFRITATAIELEQYRRRHGAYPLKPQLPLDPFSGEPLRWLPGRFLYSVGPDLCDDGGRADRSKPGENYDLVFKFPAHPSGEPRSEGIRP